MPNFRWIKTISLPIALASLFACSQGRDTGSLPVMNSSGKHVAGWVAQHWVDYNRQADQSLLFDPASSCAGCHGSDGRGGISKVSCFSGDPQNGVSCHKGILGHPVGWADPTDTVNFHSKTAKPLGAGIPASCGICHALDAAGTSVSTAPSCLSTDPRWNISCHVSSPAVSFTGCVSCHGGDAANGGNGPTGSTRPNRQDAHVKHMKAGVDCSACHFAAGTGSPVHAKTRVLGGYTSATISFKSNFKARSGSAGYDYNGLTCSGVTCHGGQTTPAWRGGSLDLSDPTVCKKCHASSTDGTAPQFNSYSSGYDSVHGFGRLHDFHVKGFGAACQDCHDGTKLASKHFADLPTANDRNFAGLPEDTIASPKITNTAAGSDYKATKGCASSCHHTALFPDPRPWRQ